VVVVVVERSRPLGNGSSKLRLRRRVLRITAGHWKSL
jgi:hypothetical protein